MANILILGGGFGGLIAAERLAAAAFDAEHQITLVSPQRKFTFYPALVQTAFGACQPEDISFDLAAKLKDLNIDFIEGKALGINGERRRAKITGRDFDGGIYYDYLVIASGRRLATEKVPGFFEYANHLLGTGAALKFGEAVRDFRGGTIVVGMCPGARLPVPACETAFALARKFETEMRDGKIRIKLVFPESLEAAFGSAKLRAELEAACKRHGINLLYDVPVCEITPDEIISSKGHKIKHDLLMLVPPFEGQTIVVDDKINDAEGYIRVNGKMQVYGLENAYAVGDIVAFSGPKFAHMAVRQARVAADNIWSEIKGREPNAEYYHEINAIIDEGGADSIHLHYGIWDDKTFALQKGNFWGWT